MSLVGKRQERPKKRRNVERGDTKKGLNRIETSRGSTNGDRIATAVFPPGNTGLYE